MGPDNLLQELCELEVALHQPEVRRDRGRLDELLHESFVEFGRSGLVYSKADILVSLPEESAPSGIWSQDFAVAELADGLALLTYRSAAIDTKGNLSRHSLRSSVWQRTARGWQMRFHQGTPTESFGKEAT
jgi:hypothetical protein